MNIQLLRKNDTIKTTHLIADFDKDVRVSRCKRVVDTEQYGWDRTSSFPDDVIFGISIFHGALPYRIRHCGCILYRHVRTDSQWSWLKGRKAHAKRFS